MKTKFEQIVDVQMIGKQSKVDLNSIFELAEQERISKSIYDSPKRLLLAIDVQKDFIEGGAFPVPGSIKDVEHIIRFIYNNMSGISRIICSLDTHIAQQIFHQCWWINERGDHPDFYTTISYDDVLNHRWNPNIGNPADSIKYLKELEKLSLGEKNLCIWPYHCIYGTEGSTLENEFAKMAYFHSIARQSVNQMIQKGTDQYSEMYGIIKPEYSKDNYINEKLLKEIGRYDEIFVVGEAASHCLLESIKQISEYFAKFRPRVTKNITVLEDCTSPIPGFEKYTEDAFERLKKKYGIRFVKSTEIQF